MKSISLAIKHNFLITTQGAVLLARNPVYYKWHRSSKQLERITDGKTKLLRSAYKKNQAFQKLSNWYFQQEINNLKPLVRLLN